MRERAALVLGAASPQSYLAGLDALERWCASERLERLRSRTLVIAAEFDYTSAAEKARIAAAIGADFVVGARLAPRHALRCDRGHQCLSAGAAR